MKNKKLSMNYIEDKALSSWLTTIPLSEEGYDLSKHLFWDLVHISYGWTLTRLPSNCECDIHHILSCKKDGFFYLQHNHIRKNTSILLKEVCKDVPLVL